VFAPFLARCVQAHAGAAQASATHDGLAACDLVDVVVADAARTL